jgi:hypothetical protein
VPQELHRQMDIRKTNSNLHQQLVLHWGKKQVTG